AEQLLATAHHCVIEHRDLVAQAAEIKENLHECLSVFAALCDPHAMGRILQLHGELREIAGDLVEVLRRTRIPVTNPPAVSHFPGTIEVLSDVAEEEKILQQLRKASVCVQAFQQLIALPTQPPQTSLTEAQECVDAVEKLIQMEAKRVIC